MEKYGYHLTSQENWKRIQKEGILPYQIKKDVFLENGFPDYPQGIWTWVDDIQGMSLAGTIIFQCVSKGTMEVVKLRFKYDPGSDVLRAPDGRRLSLTHDGELSTELRGKIETNNHLTYHSDEEAVIITRPIKASDIDIVGVYDLPYLLSQGELTVPY